MENFNMHFLPHVFRGALAIWLVILGWFAWDMRSIIKSSQRKNQISIEGRWADLEKHFERTAKPRRPFVWLHQKYLLPGTVAAQFALFLYSQGRLEEALAWADQAIRQINRKPQIFRPIHRTRTVNILRGALSARTLILTGLGRYGEAREVSGQLQQLAGSISRSNPASALLEYCCGHLDEALAQAKEVPPADAQYDSMRAVTALTYSMKGEFDLAIQALIYEPGDMTKFYSPEDLKTMNGTTEGAKLVELQQRKLAGFFPPIRLLLLARVYLAREEFGNADLALDQAEKKLGPEPGLQSSYCQSRACSFAARGKAAEAENYLERLRLIVQELPKRSFLYESHLATGRAYLYLGRLGEALNELTDAQRFALHPVEKHVTAYWIARTHEASGDRPKAMPYYEVVAADTIPSWMRKHAAEVLN